MESKSFLEILYFYKNKQKKDPEQKKETENYSSVLLSNSETESSTQHDARMHGYEDYININ